MDNLSRWWISCAIAASAAFSPSRSGFGRRTRRSRGPTEAAAQDLHDLVGDALALAGAQARARQPWTWSSMSSIVSESTAARRAAVCCRTSRHVFVALDHPGDAADLALHASQPAQDLRAVPGIGPRFAGGLASRRGAGRADHPPPCSGELRGSPIPGRDRPGPILGGSISPAAEPRGALDLPGRRSASGQRRRRALGEELEHTPGAMTMPAMASHRPGASAGAEAAALGAQQLDDRGDEARQGRATCSSM